MEVHSLNFSKILKKYLFSLIDEMGQNHALYTRNPNHDFSRIKKWSFSKTLLCTLSIGAGSLNSELLKFFYFDPNMPTLSSFIQRRAQILPSAFEHLFHAFNAFDKGYKTIYGYRPLAIDGSSVMLPYDPTNESTLRKSGKSNEYNVTHLSCLFDLKKRIYIDAKIQPIHKKDEHKALQYMVDQYNGPANTIFIMDRGYECYNSIAHIEQKGMYYIIRAKDPSSHGIAASVKNQLPDEDTFDVNTSFYISKKKTTDVKKHPELYKRIRSKQTFDFFTEESTYYPMKIRIVRFHLTETTCETILTNLPTEITAEILKELYHMRWGIETSFRELKYTIGLNAFHSKNYDFILQEIWSRLLLYNFCEMITAKVAISQKANRVYGYQVNFTNAIFICRKFFIAKEQKSPPDVEKLIQRELLPIRLGRSFPRNLKSRTTANFIYKIY